MINRELARTYCCDDISNIENYNEAMLDKTQTWHCHHRRETVYTREGLIEVGEYYHRPALELIFLSPSEHMRLHTVGKHPTEEARMNMSKARSGNRHPFYGKHHTDETKKKISEKKKGDKHPNYGKHLSEETRRRIGESHKGLCFTEEHKLKLSEAKKGVRWYNNGIIELFVVDCPAGFIRGRLKKPLKKENSK